MEGQTFSYAVILSAIILLALVFVVGFFWGRSVERKKAMGKQEFSDFVLLKSAQNFSLLDEGNREAFVSFIASETLLSSRIQEVLDDFELGKEGQQWEFIRLPWLEEGRLKGQEKILEDLSEAAKNRPKEFTEILLGKFNGLLKTLFAGTGE